MTSSARYALGTFSEGGSEPFAALVLDEREVIALSSLAPVLAELGLPQVDASSTLSVLQQWDRNAGLLQAAADALAGASPQARAARARALPLESLRAHPPVASRQIFMSGANYFKHVVDIIVDLGPGRTPGTEGMDPQQLRAFAERMMTQRRENGSPYIFTKPISALSGARDPIVIPGYAQQPDWELELAVVIGRPARHVKRSEAMAHVAGYTIANDITNRDCVWTRGDLKAMGTDWLLAKSSPTYLPVGPYMVPSNHVPNPMNLNLQLKLNGQIMQDENTDDMIFDIARLIEHTSSIVQLLPGDLVCTGSPAGNGTHYDRYLRPGDVIESTIAGLGSHRNTVTADVR